jgi:hypothetical protein
MQVKPDLEVPSIELGHLHVEESLQLGIKARIRELLPELAELILGQHLSRDPPSPCKRVEDLRRKLLGSNHSYIVIIYVNQEPRVSEEKKPDSCFT